MTRKKWQQMLSHANGANPWSTTAMGNTERFVQVEVADIGPKRSWPAHTDLSIEVGTIQIHLTAMVMNQAADLTDSSLEDPMG